MECLHKTFKYLSKLDHTKRKHAIRHLKNFAECLPRNFDQDNLKILCSTDAYFSQITAISNVFDQVHFHHSI